MSEVFFLIPKVVNVRSFVDELNPISRGWLVFEENIFFGDIQFSDDRSMHSEFENTDFEDEDYGVVWLSLKTVTLDDFSAIGDMNDRKLYSLLKRNFKNLQVSTCTYVNFEYSSSIPRSVKIYQVIKNHIISSMGAKEFIH